MKTYDDLHSWEQSRLDQAYAERPARESDGTKKQGREDFRTGWIACLEAHHVFGVFRKLLT